MQIAHETFETLFEHVRVNLGRGNVGVAKQRLHHPQVSAIVQKMTRESVAQDVRAHLFRAQTSDRSQGLQLAGKMLARDVAALAK
jgi:hypothetical protein